MYKLKEENNISEAYLVGILWNNPSLYALYSDEQLNRQTFLNDVWGFYFKLGKSMYEHEILIFDDITTAKYVKDLEIESKFKEHGGFLTIDEIMEETSDKEKNIDAYYNEVKKYEVIVNLIKLFGSKVLQEDGKYNYKKLSGEQIFAYWQDKVNKITLRNDFKHEVHYLLDGLDEYIEDLTNNPNIGMPFYKSEELTGITNGWTDSDVFMFGSFGNTGKTSFVFSKVIMSCIAQKQKLLVIANEEGINKFKELLFVTGLSAVNLDMPRKKIQQGRFSSEDLKKLEKVKTWVNDITGGQNRLIAFVYMDNYIINNVEKIVRFYYNRGYDKLIIDTHKVSDDIGNTQRWAAFVDATKHIYRLTRKEGGGLGLKTWLNFQLADAYRARRYLDFDCMAEGKAAKNEASVVWMTRILLQDEYNGEKNALKVYNIVENPLDAKGYSKTEMTLSPDKNYHLLFTPKNRNGQNTDTGQPVLVLETDFNKNTWKEVGWCYVRQDR